MRVSSWIMPLVAVTTIVVTPGLAQGPSSRRELVGVIRDPSGAPIEGATVNILSTSVLTNARGAFQLWTGDIDTVTISIRRLGYYPVSAQIAARNRQWDTVAVEMERNAQELATMKVTETSNRRATGYSDFEYRRTLGIGSFITREQIVARNSSRTSDVLSMARGVRLVKLRNGQYGVRFALYAHSQPNCIPSLWLDGQLARGMEADDLLASDLQGIELYESWSSLPMQFTGTGPTPPCGTIVVWTRVPGTK